MAYNEEVMALPGAIAAERSFVNRVYMWMFAGLLITGIVAGVFFSSPALMGLVAKSFIFLIIAQVLVVIGLTALVGRMSAAAAAGLFIFYAALTGTTFSVLFFVYTAGSLFSTFVITSLMFATMAVIGYTTKRDLTSIGHLCLMALIGVIIASVVNWFVHSPAIYWITTIVGIVIFVGLIAYDTQKIKQMAARFAEDSTGAGKYAVVAALAVYLDFINLFLLLLRIFGRRK